MKNPLVDALTGLFLVLPNIRFPVPLDGSDALSARARSVTRQVEDYLLPRARRLDAPLLAVVGGSTGAGKSTIVNSLLGQDGDPGRGAPSHYDSPHADLQPGGPRLVPFGSCAS